MKNKMIGLVMVMMLAAGTAFAALTETVDILVTPGAVAASLLANPVSYNFGTVNLTVSSNSAVAMTLTNDGSGGCTITKQISVEMTGWTATAADPAGLADQYRLYCGTATSRVSLDAFHANCILGVLSSPTALSNAANGTSIGTLAPSAAVNLWFQIDMPLTTTTSTEKTGTLTFTATTL